MLFEMRIYFLLPFIYTFSFFFFWVTPPTQSPHFTQFFLSGFVPPLFIRLFLSLVLVRNVILYRPLEAWSGSAVLGRELCLNLAHWFKDYIDKTSIVRKTLSPLSV